jgi:tetratricopeptide (TPR) repeat protein
MADTQARNTPPRLTPPGAVPDDGVRTAPRRFVWVWLLSGLLLSAAVSVVLLLPGMVQPPPQIVGSAAPPPQDATRQSAPASPQQAAQRSQRLQQKQTAEKLLEQLLRRSAELQAAGAERWAAADYARLQQQTLLADQDLDQGLFQQAATQYRELLRGLDQLEQSAPGRLADALDRGQQALQRADGVEAQRQFDIALALQPESEAARRGLQRSQTIAQVVELDRQAQAAAAQGDLQQALTAHRQALSMDADYLPAQQGEARIRDLLSQQIFVAAMSDVLNALEAGDYQAAGEALEKAVELRPEAPEVQDAQRRLAAGRKTRRLQQLSAAGQTARADEDWPLAERIYLQALELEPGAVSAQQGLRLARERIAMRSNIDRYLKQPQRLQSDQVLANAKALLQSLQAVAQPGPQLIQRRDRLQRLVARAEQPIPVVIHSDGLTEVVIYRVGRFGSFNRQQVSLRPGSYTLVGSRDGFRDVYVTLDLQPGAAAAVEVICGERI